MTERKPFVETPIIGSGRCIIASEVRPATAEDIEQARNLEVCTHTIIYDVAGWDMDIRYCYICGEMLGLI